MNQISRPPGAQARPRTKFHPVGQGLRPPVTVDGHDRAAAVAGNGMVDEGHARPVGRDAHIGHEALRRVQSMPHGELDVLLRAHPVNDGLILPIGTPVRALHLVQDLAGRAPQQGGPRERSRRSPVRHHARTQEHRELAGAGYGEQGRAREAGRAGLRVLRARGVDVHLLPFPGRGVDDRAAVGGEARVPHQAILEGQRMEGRRGRGRSSGERERGRDAQHRAHAQRRGQGPPRGGTSEARRGRQGEVLGGEAEREGEILRRLEALGGKLLQAVGDDPRHA